MNKCQLALIWLVMYVFFSEECVGQTAPKVIGKVYEAVTSSPVDRAYITLNSLPDSTIIAFTQSNAQGYFSLDIKQQLSPLYIKVSHLGHRDFFYSIPPKTESSIQIDIQLTPQEITLQEVRISSKVIAKEKGDTTTYTVDTYLQNREKTLEELLKKMPNLRVEDNGDIFFKNKRVDKLLLDGDNLIGPNYKQAIRSLDPSVLGEVQAIENDSDNPLLKGIEKGDQTVLNLKVKENRKKIIFGDIGLGAGPHVHSGLSNIFSYYKAIKVYSILAANNTGLRRNEIPSNLRPFGSKEDWIQSTDVLPFFSTQQLFSYMLKASYENINRERNAAINLSLSPSSHWRISSNFKFNQDHNRTSLNRTSQTLGDLPFETKELHSLNQIPKSFSNQFQADFSVGSSTSLKFQNYIERNSTTLDQPIMFNSELLNYQISQKNKNQSGTVFSSLDIIHRIDKKNAFKLSFHQGFRKLEELLETQTFEIGEEISPKKNPLMQTIKHIKELQEFDMRWLYGSTRFKSENGIRYGHQNYSMTLDQKISNSPFAQDSLQAKKRIFSLFQVLGWYWKKWEVSFKQEIELQNFAVEQFSNDNLIWQSKITVSYKPDKRNYFSAGFEKTTYSLFDQNLLQTPVFTDFRTKQQGLAAIIFNKQLHYNLTYGFTDIFNKRLNLSVNLFFISFPSLWSLSNIKLSPELSLSSLNYTNSNEIYGIDLKVEKLVYPLRGSLKLDLKWWSNSFQGVVNSEARITRNATSFIKFKYLSVLESPFNLEMDGSYQYSKLVVHENDFDNRQSYPTSIQSLALHYQPKNVTSKLVLENFAINHNHYLFINFRADYSGFKKFTAGIEAKNLLNNTSYRQVSFTSTQFTQSRFPLIGRFYMLFISRNF